MKRQAEVRKNGTLPWLRPDAKSQLTFAYDDAGKIIGVDAVVLSTQHAESISHRIWWKRCAKRSSSRCCR